MVRHHKPNERARPGGLTLLLPGQEETITREACPGGYTLRFTGAQAKSGLIDDVLDKVEMWFGRE